MTEKELQEIEECLSGTDLFGIPHVVVKRDHFYKFISEVRRLNKELEQHKVQEAYLLAILKKAEG